MGFFQSLKCGLYATLSVCLKRISPEETLAQRKNWNSDLLIPNGEKKFSLESQLISIKEFIFCIKVPHLDFPKI